MGMFTVPRTAVAACVISTGRAAAARTVWLHRPLLQRARLAPGYPALSGLNNTLQLTLPSCRHAEAATGLAWSTRSLSLVAVPFSSDVLNDASHMFLIRSE